MMMLMMPMMLMMRALDPQARGPLQRCTAMQALQTASITTSGGARLEPRKWWSQ